MANGYRTPSSVKRGQGSASPTSGEGKKKKRHNRIMRSVGERQDKEKGKRREGYFRWTKNCCKQKGRKNT